MTRRSNSREAEAITNRLDGHSHHHSHLVLGDFLVFWAMEVYHIRHHDGHWHKDLQHMAEDACRNLHLLHEVVGSHLQGMHVVVEDNRPLEDGHVLQEANEDNAHASRNNLDEVEVNDRGNHEGYSHEGDRVYHDSRCGHLVDRIRHDEKEVESENGSDHEGVLVGSGEASVNAIV